MIMKNIVIGLLLITALVIYFVSKFERIQKWIEKEPLKKHRVRFVVGSLVFVALSICTSMMIDESMDFFKFQEHYSTGVWAAIYCSFFYLFFFHDFELNGWVKSKEKEWKEITDIDLFHMFYMSMLYMRQNDVSQQNAKQLLFEIILEQVNERKVGSVVLQNEVTYPKHYNKYTLLEFNHKKYYVEDVRIVDYLNYVIRLMEL